MHCPFAAFAARGYFRALRIDAHSGPYLPARQCAAAFPVSGLPLRSPETAKTGLAARPLRCRRGVPRPEPGDRYRIANPSYPAAAISAQRAA